MRRIMADVLAALTLAGAMLASIWALLKLWR